MYSIDIAFDVCSDTPKGQDPDSYSPTLRMYHKILWSKMLPNGLKFDLYDNFSKLLYHKSEVGEFYLSSDSIGHTYSRVKSMSSIISQVPNDEIKSFFSICSTIGAYIIFPSKKVDNKMTINGARGINKSIKDRFDLTLLCIKNFYEGKDSPLNNVFERYKDFFTLFGHFEGYTNFFLLNDLVKDDSSINFFIPFNGFENSPLPSNIEEYLIYKENVEDFIKKRNDRITNEYKWGSG